MMIKKPFTVTLQWMVKMKVKVKVTISGLVEGNLIGLFDQDMFGTINMVFIIQVNS